MSSGYLGLEVGGQVGSIQAAFLLSVHCQNENDDRIIYSEVYTTPNENDGE